MRFFTINFDSFDEELTHGASDSRRMLRVVLKEKGYDFLLTLAFSKIKAEDL